MYFVILAFILIAGSLVWYLLGHDHGRRLPVEALWLAFVFGCLAMGIASLAEARLIPPLFLHYPRAFPVANQVGYFLGVGGVEEAAKFLPLALFIYRKSYFREHVDGVIFFAVCGLTFGLGENILYTFTYGAKVGVLRLILTPFLHAATTCILGYYLINLKLRAKHSRRLFALAVLAVPLLHGVYDFGISSSLPGLLAMSLLITLLLTQALFLYFLEANSLDRLAWVPALANNYAPAKRYCTACGEANRHHANFCEACGHVL
jgi:RsiW-degrading membrane proteinase PrsW (M82 family)